MKPGLAVYDMTSPSTNLDPSCGSLNQLNPLTLLPRLPSREINNRFLALFHLLDVDGEAMTQKGY